MKLLLLVLSMTLVGCATTNENKIAFVNTEKVNIAPEHLIPCSPLKLLPEEAEFEDSLKLHVDNAVIYADCKRKQDNSITLLKKFSNQEVKK